MQASRHPQTLRQRMGVEINSFFFPGTPLDRAQPQKTSQDTRFSDIIVTVAFSCRHHHLGLSSSRGPRYRSPHTRSLPVRNQGGIARHAPGRPTAALPITKLPGAASRQFPQRVFACAGRRTWQDAGIQCKRAAETRRGHGVPMRARARWESKQQGVCGE